MSDIMIIAQFDDYGAAQRAFAELVRRGTRPGDITLIAGDRSGRPRPDRDFGLLASAAEEFLPAVQGGRSLLAVSAAAPDSARITALIKAHMPVEIAERAARGREAAARDVTLSGAPADRPASPGGVPEITPMPTGSGAFESRETPGEWLVRREADLAEEVDPEQRERKERR